MAKDKKKKKEKKQGKVKIVDFLDSVKPIEQMASILKFSDDLKEGKEITFITAVGKVVMKKGKDRVTFMKDEERIAKSVLTSLLRGKDKKGKKTPVNQKQIDKEAKSQLLLTTKQLMAKYKPSNVNSALEFMQFGKKKQRKEIAESLKGSKKVTGNETMKVLNEIYGEIPTHTLFNIFAGMESDTKLMNMDKK